MSGFQFIYLTRELVNEYLSEYFYGHNVTYLKIVRFSLHPWYSLIGNVGSYRSAFPPQNAQMGRRAE